MSSFISISELQAQSLYLYNQVKVEAENERSMAISLKVGQTSTRNDPRDLLLIDHLIENPCCVPMRWSASCRCGWLLESRVEWQCAGSGTGNKHKVHTFGEALKVFDRRRFPPGSLARLLLLWCAYEPAHPLQGDRVLVCEEDN